MQTCNASLEMSNVRRTPRDRRSQANQVPENPIVRRRHSLILVDHGQDLRLLDKARQSPSNSNKHSSKSDHSVLSHQPRRHALHTRNQTANLPQVLKKRLQPQPEIATKLPLLMESQFTSGSMTMQRLMASVKNKNKSKPNANGMRKRWQKWRSTSLQLD